MATVIDELVARLRLDASGFKAGSDQAQTYMRQTKAEATRTAESMESGGKQAAAFFSQIKNEALGLIAVLIGAKGLEDFVKGTTTSLAGLGREARNIGVSAHALAAFSMVIERNGGSAESARQSLFGLTQQIEKAKLMGGGAALYNYLAPLGVTNLNTSPLEIFRRFVEYTHEHANDPYLVNLIGHGLGFDQGTINAVEQLKTLAEYQREYNKALRDAPTEGQVKAAVELQKQWYALQQSGEALGRAVLQLLDPALISAAKNMQGWLEANKNWLADDITGKVHALGDDVAYAAKQMGGWKSAAVLAAEYFAGPFVIAMMAGLGPVGAAIAAIIVGLDLIDKTQHGTLHKYADIPVGSPWWRGVPEKEQEKYPNSPWWQERFHALGMNPNPHPFSWWNPGSWLDRSTVTPAEQETNIKAMRRYLTSQGYSAVDIAGILSNAAAESSFNPKAENAGHYGIFQWDATRQAQFATLFHHPIQDSTLQEQMEFMNWELTHTFSGAGTKLKHAKTALSAGEIVSRSYEVAPGGHLTDLERGERAREYYMLPLGGPAPARPAAGAAPAGATDTTTITVQHMTVNTKAASAPGIGQAIINSLVAQSNRGLN